MQKNKNLQTFKLIGWDWDVLKREMEVTDLVHHNRVVIAACTRLLESSGLEVDSSMGSFVVQVGDSDETTGSIYEVYLAVRSEGSATYDVVVVENHVDEDELLDWFRLSEVWDAARAA